MISPCTDLPVRANLGWARWALLASLWGGCYNPDLTAARFSCRTTDDCPAGQSCQGGRCAPGVEDPVDLASPPPAPDLASPPPDMTSPPPPDMTSGAPDMFMPAKKSCAGASTAGYAVGARGKEEDVLACVANFAGGGAAAQCPNGYRLCSDKNGNSDLDKLKAMNVGACEAIGGFFAADVLAAFRALNGNLVCLGASIPSPFALPGCGREDQVTVVSNTDCMQFKSGFPCDKQATWGCGGTNRLSSATHTNNANQGGVLCCKG